MAENNGTATITDEQKFIQDVKNASAQSLDAITSGAFLPKTDIIIPLGDGQNQQPPQQPQQQDPAPSVPANPEALISDLATLEQEIDDAELEENRTPQSQSAFKALKTRYKNKIAETKQVISNYLTEKTALVNEVTNLKKVTEESSAFKTDAEKAHALEAENAALKQDNETLNHFRRRYDLESDPQVKQEYIEPMADIKARSLDIIQNYDLEPSFWKEALAADSEFKLNSLLDQNGFVGQNAHALKQNVLEYRQLDKEFKHVSSPEYIDATIQTVRGRSQENSEHIAKEIFKNLKTSFSPHVKELQESPTNKEHNLFVYDKVIEKAEQSFDSFRKALGPDYQNKGAISVMGHAALMTAAYPYQKMLVDHLLKEVSTLKAALEEANGSPGIRQTKEQRNSPTSFSSVIQDVKNSAKTSIEDIARNISTSK